MAIIKLNIDGREVTGHDGQTILEIARNNGIFIPTLCNDERVKASGACGICVVQSETSPRLLRSCSTAAANGLIITTNSEKVKRSRQTALELLLSDHIGDCRAPCMNACPGNTDCQGYVGLIANGEFEEALRLIKGKIPLPACIGRVCPHPCEEACRRQKVEESISIAQLKYFVADMDLKSNNEYMPDIKAATGKKVAIIGGGPGGLSAAYYLRMEGHDVTIYDAMEKMGGMLRYGIPEYRLPKTVVDAEVRNIESLGVKLINNVKVGRDITITHLRDQYDAVIVAVGAWKSLPLRCPGEELEGVVGGIDFLRKVTLNQPLLFGKKVAIVGGGNTAMDACRTSVRLGASEVYNIYRRTKAEMPAEEIEIVEAEEEGVIFKYLTNPIEIIGDENGKVSKIRLQKMELGEPDASGRRAPVAIEGAEEVIELDTVIIAIGQGLDATGLEIVELTKRNTIAADETTFRTNVEGVFAIGDATNKGASIAIEAIGEAKRAAAVVDSYLKGFIIPYSAPYLVTSDPPAEKFADKKKIAREKMAHLKPTERKDNFCEVNFGYTQEQAMKEAKRCLECGCGDYFECKLIDYANMYDVKPEKYKGEMHSRPLDTSNPFLYRNPEKCILCGLCVRVCDEVMGRTALGLVDRGFDAIVKPELGLPLSQTDCISCGQCATVCPTGAILETLKVQKSVPVAENHTSTVCSYCSVGCKTKVTSRGNMLLRTLPDTDLDKKTILCAKGRFGLSELQKQKHITAPLASKGDKGTLTTVSYDEALMRVTKSAQGIAAAYGSDAIAVAISDKLTNEEIFVIKEYAENVLKTKNITSFNMGRNGIKDVLGYDASPNTFDELLSTELIVLISDDVNYTHTIAGMKIKQAVEAGAKLVVVSRAKSQADEWASFKLTSSEDLSTLKQIAKALIDMGKKPANANGFDELCGYLSDVTVEDGAKKVAEMYAKAKKAMIVFDQKALSKGAAKLIADIAVISGHIGSPRDGIICLKPNNNSQGLCDMGLVSGHKMITSGISEGIIKGLLIFGEDVPEIDLTSLEFLMVADCVMTETAERANVVLPLATSAESAGTYTSTDRNIQKVNIAISPLNKISNWQLIKKLAALSGYVMGYNSESDILRQISASICMYKGISDIDITGGVHVPVYTGPVLYRNGFGFEDKKAQLQIPHHNVMYTHKANTNGVYNGFMNILESVK